MSGRQSPEGLLATTGLDALRAVCLQAGMPPTVRYWLDVLLTREASVDKGEREWSDQAEVVTRFATLNTQTMAALARAATACLDAHRLHSALLELESLSIARCVRPHGDIRSPLLPRGTRTLEWGVQDTSHCPFTEACWMLAEDADAFAGVALALHDLSWSETRGWRRGLAILGSRDQVNTIMQALPRRFPQTAFDRSLVRRPEGGLVSAIVHERCCWTRSADGRSSGWYRWPLRIA